MNLLRRIYLDHNASTPMRDEVRAALADALSTFEGANPASAHAFGRELGARMDVARMAVAEALGCSAHDIVFTSGGAESNALAIDGLLGGVDRNYGGACFALEHPSVTERFAYHESLRREVIWLRSRPDGVIDLDAAEAALKEHSGLVSLQLCNHELGTRQPVELLAEYVHERGAHVHCDAVQACGKVDLSVLLPHVDLLSLSAHKFGGPPGIGALYVKPGIALQPMISGGGGEGDRRGGTPNWLGAIGLGVAMTAATREVPGLATHLRACGERFWERLSECDLDYLPTILHNQVIPGTAHLRFVGIPSHIVVGRLDLAGVAVSSGAACVSRAERVSPVLLAMGWPVERASEGVRVSFGRTTNLADIDEAVSRIEAALRPLQRKTE